MISAVKKRALAVLYGVALIVMAATAGVSANWPYGCCESAASECSTAFMICYNYSGDCWCGTFYCIENFCNY